MIIGGRKLAVAITAILAIALLSCGKKSEISENTNDTQEIIEEASELGMEEEKDEEDYSEPVGPRLSNTGDDMGQNPVFDPYNAYDSLNKDQSDFINQIVNTDDYEFYEYDDKDVHIYLKGLSDTFTDSFSSYIQLWTKKGSAVPYKISYIDSYKGEDISQFVEDFCYLDIALETTFGEPVSVGYIDKEGKVNQGSITELIRDIGDIKNSNGGFAYVKYNSGDRSVSLNATYDENGDIYTIFVDIE